jgi:release factor family 3
METPTINELRRQDIEHLAEIDGPCVSIYFPTHRAGPAMQQDPIRLKNLLADARERLIAVDERPHDAETLLAPAEDLLTDETFWRHQADGLALFLAPDFSRSYRVRSQFQEQLVVGERFHLKPLLPLLTGNGRFYVLALSQEDVRLFDCTRDRVLEMDLPGVPRTIEEAIGGDRDKTSPQLHTIPGGSTGPGRGSAIFHGHGLGGDQSVEKREVARYFELVDAGIRKLVDETIPIVIAAVEYVAQIYREHTKLAKVMPEGVAGNPEGFSAEELHARSWPVVEPLFLEDRRKAAERFEVGVVRGLASNDLEAILTAAFDGRVSDLFVAVDETRWGSFDPANRRLRLSSEPDSDDDDLLDRAAFATLSRAGNVYALPRSEVPGGGPAAAIFRY